jgi:hypothetical protein
MVMLLVASTLKYFLNVQSTPQLATGFEKAFATEYDCEAAFALGLRFPFSRTGIYELELIPRVSDSIAMRIDDKHDEIARRADRLAYERKYAAFEIVKGVGPKTAEKIGRYIDVSR